MMHVKDLTCELLMQKKKKKSPKIFLQNLLHANIQRYHNRDVTKLKLNLIHQHNKNSHSCNKAMAISNHFLHLYSLYKHPTQDSDDSLSISNVK